MSQFVQLDFPVTIGALATATDCSRETIRYYEAQGLLPATARSAGGHRLYGEHHLRLLKFIRRARELGFGQDDVRRLLRMANPERTECRQVHDMALRQLEDVRLRLGDLERLEQTLAGLVKSCERGSHDRDCPIIDSLLQSAHPGTSRESPPGT